MVILGQTMIERSSMNAIRTLRKSKEELQQRLNFTNDLKLLMLIAMMFLASMNGSSSQKATRLEGKQEGKSSQRKKMTLSKTSGTSVIRLLQRRMMKRKVFRWQRLRLLSCSAVSGSFHNVRASIPINERFHALF